MDQGLAAVLGAAVGVVGTLGTALFTYGAARAQTRDAGMVEHGHWLREKRLVACTTFLEALTQSHEHIDSGLQGLDLPDVAHCGTEPMTQAHKDAFRTAARVFEEQARRLEAAREGVGQFGPHRLATLSQDVIDALNSARFQMELAARRDTAPSNESRIEAIGDKWDRAEEAFRVGVRRVMETPPRRRRVLR